MKEDKKVYLTIHGHFYQPPRENPGLESIEAQESARPFHDWNERIASECYNPNASAKIVTGLNRVIDIVNNYKYMSFNFGPTLLSWMEKFSPYSYQRIIRADIESAALNHGHGNAMAQIYNHIIMPLADKEDKYTEIIWGIRDFQRRFGRNPEGMWLSETACDDETLEALVNCGIKFTVLSPFQAAKVRPIGSNDWQDVSDGRIDPARAYRYYLKSDSSKYIDLFFYDGAISQSAAFDGLLNDGNKFISRLKEGVSDLRDYNQLIHIATDGESYGHHTKFGDMALAYVLKERAEKEGFIITNYADYLELEPPLWEADIKKVSSWSCVHGIERWRSDCGCSTGGGAGWNQKWRKPLRDALDYVRDEVKKIYEENISVYLNDAWQARNDYIDVILDRNETAVKKFITEHQKYELNNDETVNVLKLLEMMRHSLLMYTSCGWFFSEISGIETVQIMKYAMYAMKLARSFSDKDIEAGFTSILSKARSNIYSYGTGSSVYEKFVKPSDVSVKQIAALWAVSENTQDDDETHLYCFKVKKHFFKHFSRGAASFSAGRIEIKSEITFEKTDLFFALLQFPEGDFHFAVKIIPSYSSKSKECHPELVSGSDRQQMLKQVQHDASGAQEEKILNENIEALTEKLSQVYLNQPVTEVIRMLDSVFGSEYLTLKDLLIEDRSRILFKSLSGKFSKFDNDYRTVYSEGKSSIYQLIQLGIEIPEAYKLAAGYTLSHDFNVLFENPAGIYDAGIMQQALEINKEAASFKIEIKKDRAAKVFSEEIKKQLYNFVNNFETERLNKILKLFEYASKLKLNIDISEAQNLYFNKIYSRFTQLLDDVLKAGNNLDEVREFLFSLLVLGEYLNIDTDFYKSNILKLTSPKIEISA